MSVVIPVRVSKEVSQKIEELVSAGLYPNRSTLIREALRRLTISEGITAQKTPLGKVVATMTSIMISLNEKTVTDVILFGSIARGQATVESDVDLLILVENAEDWVVRQRLYDLIYPIIPGLGVDISLIVMDKKRFMHMMEEGDSFALSIVREGIQLQGDFLNEYGKSASGKSR